MMWQRALANPWSVVAGSTLALVVCNGPVVAFTFGLFLKPISQEFGWNRGAMSAASAVAALMIAVVVPFAGMLVDRFGVRRILLPVIVLSSISIAAISLTPASLLVFVTLYAVAGLATAGHGPQPYAKTIAAWFDSRRGLALGIAMAGVGLGIVLVPQLTRYLIETYGWRSAYVGLGALLFAVAFPAVALLVREPAVPHGRLSGDAAAQPGLSVRETLSGPSGFWTLATAVFLVAMAVNGTIVHVVPILTDRGLSPAVAASMLGAVGLASIAGRLLCGYLADRLFAPRVAAGFFLLPCLGIGLLMLDTGRVLIIHRCHVARPRTRLRDRHDGLSRNTLFRLAAIRRVVRLSLRYICRRLCARALCHGPRLRFLPHIRSGAGSLHPSLVDGQPLGFTPGHLRLSRYDN